MDYMQKPSQSPNDDTGEEIEKTLPVEIASGPDSDRLTAAMESWTESLRAVQKSIDDAALAIRFLRETLQQMAPVWRSIGGLEDALLGFGRSSPQEEPRRSRGPEDEPASLPGEPRAQVPEHMPEPPPDSAPEEGGPEQGWHSWRRRPAARRSEREDAEPEVVSIGPRPQAVKPVTLVPDDTEAPYSYRLSIEDSRKPLDLMPLYQALSSVPAIKNLSLVGYLNGVASISVEATDEVSPQDLETAINKSMKRACSAMVHDSSTILVQVGD